MKKIVSLVFITLLFATYTVGQRKIKILKVDEKGASTSLIFKAITDSLNNEEFSIALTPINPSTLNQKFISYNYTDGRFNYSSFSENSQSYFLKKRYKKEKKTDFIKLIEGAQWLYDNEKISLSELNAINDKLLSKYYPNIALENANRIISCNPYYIGNVYLSVFKIKITNKTNKEKVFHNNISVNNGTSMFLPLSNESIIRELSLRNMMNSKKSLILKRFNLPKTLIIPPKTTAIYYFAVLPINYSSNKLKINISEINKEASWIVKRTHTSINTTSIYYEFVLDLHYSNYMFDEDEFIYIVDKSQENIEIVNSDIFIPKNTMEKPFEIFTYGIYSKNIYFGRKTILGSDYILLEKKKRKVIKIDLEKIE
jgi:hypothetical protein